MYRAIKNFMFEKEGATAIEYALLASLIAMAIVGALITLGPALKGAYQTVQDSL